MKAIWTYLDELIEQGTVKNDSETARKVGVSRATVSDWRIGKTTPNDEQAVKLASLLRKDPGEILAECGAARAKSPETRRAWEKVAARIAAYGITACALISVVSYSEETRASQIWELLFSVVKNIFLIKGLTIASYVMTEQIKLCRGVLQLLQHQKSTVVAPCWEYV